MSASREVIAVHFVPVTDPVSRLAAPGGGFDRLSQDPCRRRAGSNVEVISSLRSLLINKKTNRSLKADGLDHEEAAAQMPLTWLRRNARQL